MAYIRTPISLSNAARTFVSDGYLDRPSVITTARVGTPGLLLVNPSFLSVSRASAVCVEPMIYGIFSTALKKKHKLR